MTCKSQSEVLDLSIVVPILSVFCFIVGIQFILFGLIAELIARTYHESQGKPTYLLRERPLTDELASANDLNQGDTLP